MYISDTQHIEAPAALEVESFSEAGFSGDRVGLGESFPHHYSKLAYNYGQIIKLCALAKKIHKGESAERELEITLPLHFPRLKELIRCDALLEEALDSTKLEIKARLSAQGGAEGQQVLYHRGSLKKYLEHRSKGETGSASHRKRIESYAAFGMTDLLDALFEKYRALSEVRHSFGGTLSWAELEFAFPAVKEASQGIRARAVIERSSWIKQEDVSRLKNHMRMIVSPKKSSKPLTV